MSAKLDVSKGVTIEFTHDDTPASGMIAASGRNKEYPDYVNVRVLTADTIAEGAWLKIVGTDGGLKGCGHAEVSDAPNGFQLLLSIPHEEVDLSTLTGK